MDKITLNLSMALFALDKQTKEAILGHASGELHRDITWDDIEDYDLTLVVELSLFEKPETISQY